MRWSAREMVGVPSNARLYCLTRTGERDRVVERVPVPCKFVVQISGKTECWGSLLYSFGTLFAIEITQID